MSGDVEQTADASPGSESTTDQDHPFVADSFVADSFDDEPNESEVLLDDLGLIVDRGMEHLVRACWRRGIATGAASIGRPDRHDGDGWITFHNGGPANRWEALTGIAVEWQIFDGVATNATAFFPTEAIPSIVSGLTAQLDSGGA